MATDKIDASGLKALRKAFQAAGTKDFDKWLSRTHQHLAQLVVDRTRAAVASESSSTAAALAAAKSSVGARVNIRAAAAPQAAGVIFGANHDQVRTGPSGRKFLGYNQFRAASAGPYYLWPQLDEVREQVTEMYASALNDYLTHHGVPR